VASANAVFPNLVSSDFFLIWAALEAQ
jgi:hypothetical protein